jgi:hypothetical protein
VVDDRSLNVGDGWVGESITHTFTVRNASDAPVSIKRFSASCYCTRLSPEVSRFDPGNEIEVTAEIDLEEKLFVSDGGRTVGNLTVLVRCELDDGSRQEWSLSGTVHRPLAAKSQTVQYVDDANAETLLTVRKHPQVTRVWTETDDPDLNVTEKSSLKDSDEANFVLSRTPGSPLGDFDTEIRLFASSADGRDFAPYPIAVRGRCSGGLEWMPEQVVLAEPGMIGDQETVWISSSSGRPLEFVAVDCPDDVFDCSHDAESSSASVVHLLIERHNGSVTTTLKTAEVRVSLRSPGDGELMELRLPVSLIVAAAGSANGD